ncbi:DUF2829 domain-containing protein [Rhizobium phage RHph_I1_18]|nr:DUF2829 domain-containing protein [Rhizobium phage RHph_I1_18]
MTDKRLKFKQLRTGNYVLHINANEFIDSNVKKRYSVGRVTSLSGKELTAAITFYSPTLNVVSSISKLYATSIASPNVKNAADAMVDQFDREVEKRKLKWTDDKMALFQFLFEGGRDPDVHQPIAVTTSSIKPTVNGSVISTTFDFADASRKLKEGKKVAREGWNGKGMYLFRVPTSVLAPTSKVGAFDTYLLQPFIVLFTGGSYVAWTASQSDVDASDWVEYTSAL